MTALTIASTLVLTTLASQDAMATGRSEVGIARRKAPQVAPVTSQGNLLVSTLARPFSQSEWPNPAPVRKPPQFHLESGRLLQAFILKPFSQDDWQNPYVPSAIQVTYGAVEPSPEAAPEPEPEAQPIGRAETLVPRSKARPTADVQRQNLLQSTLNPVVTQPFRQTDWRVTRRPARPGQHQVSFYVVDETTPFSQSEWPNPLQPKRSIDRLTWTDTRKLTLGEPAPPVKQTEWPNPQPRKQPEFRGFAQWRPLWLVDVVDDTPQSLSEWPTPPALKRSSDLGTWTQNLLQTTLDPGDRPFVPVDFPNPLEKGRAIDLHTHLEVRPFYFEDEYPFVQNDWPLAVVTPERVAETWTDNLLGSTLSIQQQPFATTDRPNPAPLRYPTHSWTLNLLQSTLTPDPAPHVQTDWPLFLARPPALDLRTWIETRKTYYEDEDPRNQRDWPVPAPLRIAKGQGFVETSYGLTPAGQVPAIASTAIDGSYVRTTAIDGSYVRTTGIDGSVGE